MTMRDHLDAGGTRFDGAPDKKPDAKAAAIFDRADAMLLARLLGTALAIVGAVIAIAALLGLGLRIFLAAAGLS